MKIVQWLFLAGSEPNPGQTWLTHAEYPIGAKLLAVTTLSKDNAAKYGGLFEFDPEVKYTEKRSFRIIDMWPGEALQVPDEAVFCFPVQTSGGGGIFGSSSSSVHVVYEVPCDFTGLSPDDLKALASARWAKATKEINTSKEVKTAP